MVCVTVLTLLTACAGRGRVPVAASDPPSSGNVLSREDARHLASRTGFGVVPAAVAHWTGRTRRAAVDELLAGLRDTAVTPPPAGIDRYVPSARTGGRDDDAREAGREQAQLSIALRAWWLREMRETPSPLTERLTLFWHNHFVSSQEKVRSATLMYRQNVLLRRHAGGSFARMLRAVARDPAMVVYLDSARNRKGAPNENFARELMELFTLGEGRYTESDVKEAARAFTGWGFDRESGAFRFRPAQHDGGVKTVLGYTARLDGDAVIDRLLADPRTAEHIVRKLWREFVSPDPDSDRVTAVAADFHRSGHDVKVALRTLLLSDEFWAPAQRGVLVKSPTDLVVGSLAAFDAEVPDYAPFALLVARLGQNLFAPPNVKGWPGGEVWSDATTLLQRKQYLDGLFRGQDLGVGAMMRAAAEDRAQKLLKRGGPQAAARLTRALAGVRLDADAWIDRLRARPEEWRDLVVLDPVVAAMPAAPSVADLRALFQDPVYQLR